MGNWRRATASRSAPSRSSCATPSCIAPVAWNERISSLAVRSACLGSRRNARNESNLFAPHVRPIFGMTQDATIENDNDRLIVEAADWRVCLTSGEQPEADAAALANWRGRCADQATPY